MQESKKKERKMLDAKDVLSALGSFEYYLDLKNEDVDDLNEKTLYERLEAAYNVGVLSSGEKDTLDQYYKVRFKK